MSFGPSVQSGSVSLPFGMVYIYHQKQENGIVTAIQIEHLKPLYLFYIYTQHIWLNKSLTTRNFSFTWGVVLVKQIGLIILIIMMFQPRRLR
jgi:hypothetical protein